MYTLLNKWKDAKNEIDKMLNEIRNLGDKKSDFLLLIDMVKDSMGGSFKIPALTLASIIGSIIYVISPFDAIPDIIPVLGWGDDMTVIGVVMASIAATVADYKKHKGIE